MKEEVARTCVLIERSGQYRGKQGLDYFAGVSAETTGATGLCLHVVTIPPLARAKPHLHENHESAVYVLSGEAGMWYGENLREHVWLRAGDFLYIPANTPHLPYNASESEPCTGLIARTDPNEQESVTLLPLPDPGVATRSAGSAGLD
ncbi:MAG: cupin domain-containing protein [Candidatus Sulfopaludibacter sp.]|nr:cupin domain-containing protein [Candidatus Sulfopaludibacter sp.]